VLREEIAHKLGYATWADYQLDGRTAKNTSNVMAFLDALKAPLIERQDEMAGLLRVKKGWTRRGNGRIPGTLHILKISRKQQQYDL